ncbi:MAG: ATP-binding protein [Candidatus Aenigmarchaeota archaeon]|nr:ATP-binding protein [Candidatus Aenigmarchaeota archaeon]
MKFYNRENELNELETAGKISERHKILMVLTGRRRVGKTELIHQFFSKTKGIYFFVNPRKTSSELLSEFSSIISSELSLPEYIKIGTWPSFLKVLFDASKEKRLVIAIDEFQRFLSIEPHIIFELQKEWDAHKGKLFLLISGSSVGMVRKIFIEQKAPLFKRAHNILTIDPFGFEAVGRILGDFGITGIEEKIKLYSIYGGIPMYYALIGDYNIADTLSSIDRLLLRELAPLKDEVSDILIEEFGREVPSYYSIITAIAIGKNTAKEICDYAGIKETSFAPYIENLSKVLGIVAKDVPATEKNPERSKKGRYFLKDNFFRFWFKYIYRNMSAYEIKNYAAIREKITSDLSSFIGRSFEQVCREFMLKLNREGTPFFFEKIGRQWGKFRDEGGRNVYEIDIVALSERSKEILFCECKWQGNVDAQRVLEELKEKAKLVQWNNGTRKEYYAIFAKSFRERMKEPNLLLFDLADLEEMVKAPQSSREK